MYKAGVIRKIKNQRHDRKIIETHKPSQKTVKKTTKSIRKISHFHIKNIKDFLAENRRPYTREIRVIQFTPLCVEL